MRALAAMLPGLATALALSACGSSSSPSATTPPPTVTAPTTVTTAAPPPPTRYRTRLDRDLARAFRDAYVTQPAPPTESQIPPRLNILVTDPPAVCTARGRGVYRCVVSYQPTNVAAQLRAVYLLHRRGSCFTATGATAFPADSPMRRIHNC